MSQILDGGREKSGAFAVREQDDHAKARRRKEFETEGKGQELRMLKVFFDNIP